MSYRNPSSQRIYGKARARAALRAARMAAAAVMLLALLTGCASQQTTPTDAQALTPTAGAFSPAEGEEQVVELVDRYYTCINFADPTGDSDYEECWDLLSDRPGEYQSTLDKEEFIEFWKLYTVAYAIYYCPRGSEHFINAETYIYALSDLSASVIAPQKVIVEYSFSFDGQAWKIASGASLERLSGSCESRPSVNRLALPY